VVTSPAPPPFDQATTVVTGQTLRRRGHRTVAEALETLPAVQGRDNARGERILVVRGFDQRQMVVLLDGVPLRIPYDGRLDLGKVPVGLLQSIEVIRGPASLAYGPTGMGGAILLHTRTPAATPRLVLDWRGSLGASQHHVVTRVGDDRGGVVLAGQMLWRRYLPLPHGFEDTSREAGPRRNNSDRLSLSLGASGRLRPHPDHTLQLLAMGSTGEHGVPPLAETPNPRYWRFAPYQLLLAGLTHRGRWSEGILLSEAVYLAYYRNVLYAYDDARTVTRLTDRAFRSVYHDLSAGGRLWLRADLPRPTWARLLRLHAWLEARHDRHTSHDDTAEGGGTSGGIGASAGVATTYLRGAVEAGLLLRGGHALRLQAEVQSDLPGHVEPESARPTWFFGPLLGYGWQGRILSLHALVARRARFPSLRERFSSAFGRRTPNPTLGPESAWIGQVGGRLRLWRRRLSITTTVFSALVDGLIDERRPCTDDRPECQTLQQQNVGRVLQAGLELGVRLRAPHGIVARVAYQYLYSRALAETDEATLTGRAPHRAYAELVYTPWRYLELRTALRVQGPLESRHPDTGLVKTLDPYALWDARVTLGPWHGMSLYVSATNLLDSLHVTEVALPGPGRIVWVGARYVSP
jgi:iron complex outermembrane receptor protein